MGTAWAILALFLSSEDQPARISFLNDVLPVLTRVGCNQGACHGSESGKGGFKLSLRGFAPELDHHSISRDVFGRRINLANPEESLLLRKPALEVSHQGGRVLPRDAEGRRIILGWLRQGARGPGGEPGPGGKPGPGGEPRPTALELRAGGAPIAGTLRIEPPAAVEIQAIARFSDGTTRDVTRWSLYDSSDPTVAAVDDGRARAVGPGLAAGKVVYQDQVAAVEILVPYPPLAQPRDYSALPRNNFIDELVIARWEELRLWPSPPAGDAAFLRRLSLDLTGALPEPDEVRAYLRDPDPGKREKAIDRLLDSPRFVDLWTQKWSEILRVSREWLGEKPMWQIHRWLRDRIARNVPWDEVVRELVAGAGNSALEGPPNFYRSQKVFNEPELWPLVAAETTAQSFLGLRMQCARCHNHPQDRWTQADYYGLPQIDQTVSALLEDLRARGLLESTLVLMTGEFGRTPRINGSAGRDHWPFCFSYLITGAGIPGGRVIGKSDEVAAYPADDPVSPENTVTSVFSILGLDLEKLRAAGVIGIADGIPRLWDGA